MALITERPRSASVRALEEVELGVLDRDEFLEVWRTSPEALLPLIRTLCERIRTLDALVTGRTDDFPIDPQKLRAHLGTPRETEPGLPATGRPGSSAVVLEALTPAAEAALGGRLLTIDRFPYRIGRGGERDPFSHNELVIADEEPFQVSRNHCALVRVESRVFLIDRGSQLGTQVNRVPVGGSQHTGCVELSAGASEIVLGSAGSPYRFRITIAK
jgi:hypothetical protein